MHIPDGFLNPLTASATFALSAAGLAFALHHTRKHLPPRKIPLLGLSAAFVFAAQMLNFPIPGATSGHLIGGTLVAILLGPSAAVIVISTVLIVQCLVFADGGITALGANIFNMALIDAFTGWFIYSALSRHLPSLKGRLCSAAIAAFLSTVLASIACAGELASSHTTPWSLAFPMMASTHALIGIGEAAITALVLSSIAAVRPDLLSPASQPQASLRPLLLYGLLASLGLALFVSPFACPLPDGLDHVAQSLGFDSREQSHPSLLPSYTALTAALATLLIFATALLLSKLLTARRPAD